MAILRGAIGFLQFFAVFTFKHDLFAVGVVAGAAGIGLFGGNLLAPRLRTHLREEMILAGSLLVAAAATLLGVLLRSTLGIPLAFLAVGLGTAAGKIGFDSLLQRDGPDAVRGRAFARFETRFQAAWVLGAVLGIIPVAAPAGLRASSAWCWPSGACRTWPLCAVAAAPPAARSYDPKRSTGPSTGPARTSGSVDARPPGAAAAKPPSGAAPCSTTGRRRRPVRPRLRPDGGCRRRRSGPCRHPAAAPAPAVGRRNTRPGRAGRASISAVDITFRPVGPAELPAFCHATSIGFSEHPTYAEQHPRWAALDLERARCRLRRRRRRRDRPQLLARADRPRRAGPPRGRGQRGHRPSHPPSTGPPARHDARPPRRGGGARRAGREC